jgi:hypothetical protein
MKSGNVISDLALFVLKWDLACLFYMLTIDQDEDMAVSMLGYEQAPTTRRNCQLILFPNTQSSYHNVSLLYSFRVST